MASLPAPKYQQERGPEPLGFEEYKHDLLKQWNNLLEDNPSEKRIQRFLEDNPCLVPGAWTPGTKSGHYPLHCALISQPRLPGLQARQPDFMWISLHSLAWYPTLIEIEKPDKRLFRKDGVPRADFTQAFNQIAQWRTWFSDPSHQTLFAQEYGVTNWALARHMQMKLHFILIYGRRREFENKPELKKHRPSLVTASDVELMSYDRLNPDRDLEEAITVRATGNGQYKVVSIPPIFTLSPTLADRLLHVRGFKSALNSSETISPQRTEFLLKRIDYWRNWASSDDGGLIAASYPE